MWCRAGSAGVSGCERACPAVNSCRASNRSRASRALHHGAPRLCALVAGRGPARARRDLVGARVRNPFSVLLACVGALWFAPFARCVLLLALVRAPEELAEERRVTCYYVLTTDPGPGACGVGRRRGDRATERETRNAAGGRGHAPRPPSRSPGVATSGLRASVRGVRPEK